MSDVNEELRNYALKVHRGQVTEGDRARVEAIGRALDKGLEIPPAAVPVAPPPAIPPPPAKPGEVVKKAAVKKAARKK